MPRMKELWTPLKLVGVRYFKDADNVYYKKVGKKHRQETRPFWKYKRFGLATALLILLPIPGYIGYEFAMDKASNKLVDEVASGVSKEEVQELLKDPTVQEMVEKELGTKKASALLQQYEVESSGIATSGISDDSLTFKKPDSQGSVGNKEVNNEKESVPVSSGSKPSTGSNEPGSTPSDSKDDEPKLMFQSREEATKFVMSKFSMSEISSFAKMAQGGLTTEEKAEIKSTVQSRLSDREYEALKVFGLIELSKQ